MKRIIQCVSRLYPASWQRRYGIEFDALLEDVDPNWHTLLNVFGGVMEMQLRTRNAGKILVIAGMAGALVGLAAWLAIPNRYGSTAVLTIALSPDRSTTDKAIAHYVNGLAAQSISRPALTQIIRKFSLYEPKQAKIPLGDIVDNMERDITIRPIGRPSDRGAAVFSIQFVYSDPVTAQHVTRDLADRFVDSNLDFSLHGGKSLAERATLDLLNAPSQSNRPLSPRLSRIMTTGTAAGLALGMLLALIRRSMRPARSTETR